MKRRPIVAVSRPATASELNQRMLAGARIARINHNGVFNQCFQSLLAGVAPEQARHLKDHVVRVREHEQWRTEQESKERVIWRAATEGWDIIKSVESETRFEALGFDAAGKLVLCVGQYDDVKVHEVTAMESIIWMAEAERMLMLFEESDCHPEATVRWLRYLAGSLEQKARVS